MTERLVTTDRAFVAFCSQNPVQRTTLVQRDWYAVIQLFAKIPTQRCKLGHNWIQRTLTASFHSVGFK